MGERLTKSRPEICITQDEIHRINLTRMTIASLSDDNVHWVKAVMRLRRYAYLGSLVRVSVAVLPELMKCGSRSSHLLSP